MKRKTKGRFKVTFENFKASKLKIVDEQPYYDGRRVVRNYGNCRKVYRLGGIVIKFEKKGDTSGQCKLEVNLYKRLPKKDKKYFARTKGIRKAGRLVEVQEYIPGSHAFEDWESCRDKIRELEEKYERNDFHECNVKIYKGEPVIIDFAW